MDFDLLYPNRFLKAAEFRGKDVTLTIRAVTLEELDGDKGKKSKGILTFDGTAKQLVLNRTNGECLKAMFGRETNNWVGKRVTLFPAPFTDNLGLGVEVAIRVRGSPDIQQDVTFELKLPRKKAVRATMKKTGQRPANGQQRPPQQAAPTPPPPPPPPAPVESLPPPSEIQPGEFDPETGEIPFG